MNPGNTPWPKQNIVSVSKREKNNKQIRLLSQTQTYLKILSPDKFLPINNCEIF
jgi:hypothetical protein